MNCSVRCTAQRSPRRSHPGRRERTHLNHGVHTLRLVPEGDGPICRHLGVGQFRVHVAAGKGLGLGPEHGGWSGGRTALARLDSFQVCQAVFNPAEEKAKEVQNRGHLLEDKVKEELRGLHLLRRPGRDGRAGSLL